MTASAAQQKKFDTFMRHPDAPALMELAVEVIIAADLDWDELGTRWGITVCVDRTSVLRLNVGNRVLLDATTQHGIQLFVVMPAGEPNSWGESVRLYEGFPQVEHSRRLVARHPDDMIGVLLDHADLAEKVRAHADASSRNLPRPDWHNPLVNELLEQAAEAVFDDYQAGEHDDSDYSQPDVADPDTHLPPTTTSTCRERAGIWHPAVITGLSAPGHHDPLEDIAGGALWWGSAVAPTALWAGDPVDSRDHFVTPIYVETRVPLNDDVSDDEQYFIASECNRLGGVSSVALIDDHLLFRAAISTFSGIDGWVGVWTGAAVMSSAMTALHLTADIRRPSQPGRFGPPERPNPLIADYAGWEVPAEDRHRYVLPTATHMEQAIAMFEQAGLRGHFQGDGSMLVTTPSEVTLRFSVERRRPWGDGLTCTVRLPTDDQPRLNLELAALLNRTEWNDVPAVNVWGGWAGTDTALELHSFVPRMLFRPDADQARAIVANLLTWCVNRGQRAEQMLMG